MIPPTGIATAINPSLRGSLILLTGQNFGDFFCQTPVLGLRLGVDFTFVWDNNNNNNNNNNDKNPHLNFFERNSTRG